MHRFDLLSPGVLTYTPRASVPQTSVSTLRSGTIKVDPDARDRTEPARLGPVYPSAGCALLTDTAQFVRTWTRGKENISRKWRWIFRGYVQVDQSCNYSVPVEQQPQGLMLDAVKW